MGREMHGFPIVGPARSTSTTPTRRRLAFLLWIPVKCFPGVRLSSWPSINRPETSIWLSPTPRSIGIFDENGTHLDTWSAINGVNNGQSFGGIHVAVDNSDGQSRGRVYLSLTHPEDDVEALDAERRPVQFPATADYIDGNAITGTPSGPFGEVEHITVDGDGNIYVTDAQLNVVDEFASTGEFLRSFPAPAANFENPDKGGVAVDPTNGDVLITEGCSTATRKS